jgi:hypothetical protein
MTGFVRDGGGPIVAQIASPIGMAVKNTALGFPIRMFNSQPPGAFGETRLAELAIDVPRIANMTELHC